jgi:molecular chaperone Hsp33
MLENLPPANHSDQIVPFQLVQSGLRGRFVRLGSTLDDILGKHDYPPPVANLVAEAATLASLMGSMLKDDGMFTLQAKGNGPISLLVADYTADGGLRAYAAFNGEGLSTVPNTFADLLGTGYLAFTVDRGGKADRYQGVVEIAGDTLCSATEHYFLQSEQIHTHLRYFAGPAGAPWQTAAICLQTMPPENPSESLGLERLPDGWDEALALTHTLTAPEALGAHMHMHDILYRLFHEGGVKAYETVHVRHQCRCSLERAERAVTTLSEAEAEEFADNRAVVVKCEFCNSSYVFTLDQVAALREAATRN